MPTRYTTLRVGEKDRYARDWSAYLSAGAAISSSVWSVSPATGLDTSSEQTESPKTSILVEAVTVGTYRLTNTVTFSDGAVGKEEIVFSVASLGDVTSGASGAYLSASDAEARLWARYGAEASLYAGDLETASDALDSMAPFEGERTQHDQEREFPRVVHVGDSRNAATVPGAVLDWVALKALELSSEHEPGVRSEGAGRVSVSYSEPKRSQLERRMDGLIEPYLLKTGRRA